MYMSAFKDMLSNVGMLSKDASRWRLLTMYKSSFKGVYVIVFNCNTPVLQLTALKKMAAEIVDRWMSTVRQASGDSSSSSSSSGRWHLDFAPCRVRRVLLTNTCLPNTCAMMCCSESMFAALVP